MRRLMLLVAFLGFLGVQAFAQKTITGTVTSAEDGSALPGVSVVVKGTSIGTITDVDGKYTLTGVPDDAKTLVFSFVGYKTLEAPITGETINVQLEPEAVQVEEVVVTALGVKREEKTLPYTQQQVKSDELDIAQNINFESALAGKVSGVQIKTQPGSKLGYSGKVRIRGGLSLNSDASPLYIIDGIPADANTIDVNDIESITVLKGPNATALYGQRAQNGVIIITTKKGEKNSFNVIINSSFTMDRVAYLPKYQNDYGQGYDGQDEWVYLQDTSAFGTFVWNYMKLVPYWNQDSALFWNSDARFIFYTLADESWGPKFDGQPYRPWYTWWPTGPDGQPNPYYGQSVPYNPQTNNVKDFYQDALTFKNNVVLSGGTDKLTARLSVTNLNQNGIMPYTWQKRNTVSMNFDYQFTKKFKAYGFINYEVNDVRGDFADGYANQTSGSFNQWFARDLNMNVQRELQGMRIPEGYLASWNWWGPYYFSKYGQLYGIDGFKKPVFWFNHYDWLRLYDRRSGNNHLIANVNLEYKLAKDLTVRAGASRNQNLYQSGFKFPFELASSAAPDLYNSWVNSFGVYKNWYVENNYNAALMYKHNFGAFDVDAMFGGNIRYQASNTFYAWMDMGDKNNPLILPDVYLFSNATLPVTPRYSTWYKQVNSIYGRLSVGFKNMLYLDGTIRRDWSSALPATNNGYSYPSIGLSFIFSELLPKNDILTFGKFRAGWAQVGNDVGAQALVTTYGSSAQPFNGTIPLTYTPNTLINPNVHPAINSSVEAGMDLRFFKSRVGMSVTYYDELHKDDIIAVTIPSATGYSSYLTNAGQVRRYGVEMTLDGTPVKTKNFEWNIALNLARNRSVVLELPEGMTTMLAPDGQDDWRFVQAVHVVGGAWGELQGVAIADTVINGETLPVLQSNGVYIGEPNSTFGSILPDIVGGLVHSLRIYNFNIAATFDFQKGGKFYSLSEFWGEYSGLYYETAADGVRETGIDLRGYFPDGDSVGTVNIAAQDYYKQFYSNEIAEPFIHDASYLKLRELSITYDVPKTVLNKVGFLNGMRLGFIGRNLALISVSKDNFHRWDPSELSHNFGENGQLPGVRSLGFYMQLKF